MHGSLVSTPHLHLRMKAQEYIQSKLSDLLNPGDLVKPGNDEQLINEILRLTLSKKFRKYSVKPEVLDHIKASIKASVEDNQPIKFTLPFGAYKLWRLSETPEVDWAELFTMMYFSKWLKPICEIYEPGVWFDFFSDDVIIPRLNNIPAGDLKVYNKNFHGLLDFIRPYQPKNLKMTLTRVGDRYNSLADFNTELDQNIAKLASELEGGLPVLNETGRATVELNVKTTPEQRRDPQWREKVQLMHDAYGSASQRRPYYRDPTQHKIMVVNTPLWGMLCVGSTKDTTMKFWVGAGLLKPRDASFRQIILSPHQLEKTKLHLESMAIKGLEGKNLDKIGIID